MLAKDGAEARGSARSIPGISISDLLSDSSGLLLRFGGHPMAAGMRLAHKNVPTLRRALSESYDKLYGDSLPEPKLIIDAELPFSTISENFIKDIHRLAPFGAGNPQLVFSTRGVSILDLKEIGRNQNHRKLLVSDSAGINQEFLWWNSVDIKVPETPIDVAYNLDLSVYRGKTQIQITLKDFRLSSDLPVIIKEDKLLKIIDHRGQNDQLNILKRIDGEYPDCMIWSEFNHPPGIISHPRNELQNSPVLIIWTTPPSASVFRNAIEIVSPDILFLFAVDPMAQDKRTIIEAILGLLQHLRTSQKAYSVEAFAQAISQTPAIIDLGLNWIHSHGDYDLSQLKKNNRIQSGTGTPLPDFTEIDKNLSLLLQETASYRMYFKNAGKKYLL
jgi:single-stranded-DNA-specific exonuclease